MNKGVNREKIICFIDIKYMKQFCKFWNFTYIHVKKKSILFIASSSSEFYSDRRYI